MYQEIENRNYPESPSPAKDGRVLGTMTDSGFFIGDYKMVKLCECGCGQPAPIAKESDKRRNCIKGQPRRFIQGHNGRLQPIGNESYRWKGGTSISSDGRTLIYFPDHPRSSPAGQVFNYILVVEKILGEPLSLNHPIHHFDGNPSNDKNSNLIVCENNAYHRLLHQRTRAYKACGHVSWRKCSICKQYDKPDNLYINKTTIYHKYCKSMYKKQRNKIKNQEANDD